MRGNDEASLEVETCRAAFELRRPDARERAGRAIARARRRGDVDLVDQARALIDTLNDHQHRRLDDDDLGPTAETLVRHRHCRQRGDTIEALVASRKLGFGEQGAAVQISEVYEALTAKLWVRAPRLEQGRLAAGSNGGIPERFCALYHSRYKPWATWMRDPKSLFQVCTGCGRRYVIPRRITCECGCKRFWRAPPHLPLVLSIAVHGAGLEHCAAVYRMRRQQALRLLQLGLSRYADFG